jgi:hypothetical protein
MRDSGRVARLSVWQSALTVLAALSAAAPAPLRAEPTRDSSAAPILSAIETLESGSDAKCYSSASRFEDFLYGTPLGNEARQAQGNQQKRLVEQIWSAASRVAVEAGEDTLARHRISEQLDEMVRWEDGEEGEIRVQFPTLPDLRLSKLRAEQYASIAYSLRAILSVQQDSLLFGESPLGVLTPEGLELLRESVDIVTLSALLLADREARRDNQTQIAEIGLHSVWQRLVPAQHAAVPESDTRKLVSADSRSNGLALLEDMIDRKLAAYRAYNDLEVSDARALFVYNIARFYARAHLPEQSDRSSGSPGAARSNNSRRELLGALNDRLDGFAATLLNEAGDDARHAGHRLIRAGDASLAVQRLIPHRIDEFEDVHFFGRLAEDDRVTLEAYDCDSFRDFGVHWPPLKRALRRAPPETPLPDPFAAEILAEAISQYGVLLLRVAGSMVGRDQGDVRLAASNITSGEARIQERARRHHASPPRREPRTRLASAAGDAPVGPATTFFTDITSETGVHFVHRTSRWLDELRRMRLNTPPTFSGGGVAAEDVNGDSHIDLLFVGGIANALLINDGRGRFNDLTREAGIDLTRPDGSHGEARQPIIADFDNDGLQDILITYANDDHQLYRNLGDMRFENVSARAGLAGKGLIGGPASVLDFDGDALPDIYIGHMGNYLDGAIPAINRDNRNGLPNKLFRNLGGMRFEDVSDGSGAADTGWAQAVSHVDFDRDGRQDLLVANDFGRNAFLRNLGDGRFQNVAPDLGMTKAFHSMNLGVSDLNRDGFPDVYISNIATLVKDNKYVFPDVGTPMDFDLRALAGMLVKESDVLYLSRLEGGNLAGYEPSKDVERGATSTGWAWGAEFFDFDHDGDDDLYVVNGTNDYNTAYPLIFPHKQEDGSFKKYLLSHKRESNVFFVNRRGKLENRSEQSGADFVGNSRSTVYLDLEGDGDLDIAVNNFHAPARLLRNNSEQSGLGWLKIRLIGDPARSSTRDAIGARILATSSEGLHVLREVQVGSGYLSMRPKQQHFGVGRAESVDVQITWPGGELQTLKGLAPNRAYRVRQGVGILPETGDVAARASATREKTRRELAEASR